MKRFAAVQGKGLPENRFLTFLDSLVPSGSVGVKISKHASRTAPLVANVIVHPNVPTKSKVEPLERLCLKNKSS